MDTKYTTNKAKKSHIKLNGAVPIILHQVVDWMDKFWRFENFKKFSILKAFTLMLDVSEVYRLTLNPCCRIPALVTNVTGLDICLVREIRLRDWKLPFTIILLLKLYCETRLWINVVLLYACLQLTHTCK